VLVTAFNWPRGNGNAAGVVASVVPAVILAGFWIYFMRKTQLHALADEVLDLGDSLKIRRGRTQATVPLSAIAGAQSATVFNLGGVRIDFVEPNDLGGQISFWVESKSASDVVEMNRVASDIRARALKAREGCA
jgi:hypothetical protein